MLSIQVEMQQILLKDISLWTAVEKMTELFDAFGIKVIRGRTQGQYQGVIVDALVLLGLGFFGEIFCFYHNLFRFTIQTGKCPQDKFIMMCG